MARTMKDLVTWLKQWFYDKTEIDTSLNTKSDTTHTHSYLYQTVTLSNNEDLDDVKFKSPGLYAIPGAVSKTIVNRPFPNSYLLNNTNKHSWLKIEQYKKGGTYAYIQIYYSMNTGYEHIFYRTSTSNGWNDWKKIANIDEIPIEISDLTDGSEIIKKSNITGLVKNDGSIDENTYLTSLPTHNHGAIENSGTINNNATEVNNILVSNNSHQIRTISQVPFNKLDIGKSDITGLGIADATHSHSYSELTNKPTFTETVTSSTSGAYEIGKININGSDVSIYGKDTTTNTIGYQLRTNSTSLTASDKTYRYRLILETPNGTYMPVNTSTSTSATAKKSSYMNTRPFLLFGDIRIYNATTVVDANETFLATTLWQQYNMNLGYSFNNTGSALTLTPNAPVYMVARQLSPYPSLGVLEAPYFTQSLPNSSDGLIYILLGYATSGTQIELSLDHPIFEFKNGDIQLFSLNTHGHGLLNNDGTINNPITNVNNIVVTNSSNQIGTANVIEWEVVPMYKHWVLNEEIDTITLRVNEILHLAELKVFHTTATVKPGLSQDPNDNSTTTAYLNAIPSQYRPSQQLVAPMVSRYGRLLIDSSGDIFFQSTDSDSHSNVNANSTLMWYYD
ncbi:pyocin knob domain-containing protein [Methanobrevibacter sp.]|uniref:pyocin knob domain-containing protein n=1 Tax=Methanobrevibacter sp. TaxID=66852 RepID=UPI00388F3148